MPLLRKGILLPVKGVDFSVPSTFIDPRNGFPTNWRYKEGILRKRPGKVVQGGQLSGAIPVMGFGKIELNSELKYLVRASKTTIEQFVPASTTWQKISTTAFTGEDDDFFAFANATEEQLLISTNFLDAVQKWAGTGNQADLGGSPPKAKYVTYLSPYTMLGYLDESGTKNPWKVAWPDTGDSENWTTGNSGSALAADEPSPIQNIARLNEFIGVYKKKSLVLARKVDPPDIFKLETVKTGIGLGAPRAFSDAEGVHYFMGENDFFSWNSIRPESIGNAVRDSVFGRINRDKINRCFSIHVQELNEVWFFIVVAGQDWPTEVWKYNYRKGYWFFDTCNSLTAAITWPRVSSLAWDDAQGTWDSQATRWDESATVESWEDVMFGTSDGYAQKIDYTITDDNGVAVNAFFDTKDFISDAGLEFSARWLELHLWARGPGKVYVDFSTDFGSTWTNIPYTTSQAYADLTSVFNKFEFYLDTWAEHIRFRVRNAESNEPIEIQALYPFYVAMEEVRGFRS